MYIYIYIYICSFGGLMGRCGFVGGGSMGVYIGLARRL